MNTWQTIKKTMTVGLVLLAGWALALPAWAEMDPAKKRDIQTLMEVSGTIESLKQFRPLMLQSYSNILKTAYKDRNIPQEFWDEFLNTIITDADLDSLVEEILPIYDQNFTHDEIRELITAFQTPAYRKWVTRLPTMMQASSEAGRRWGRNLAQSGVIQQRLETLKMKYSLGEPSEDAPQGGGMR